METDLYKAFREIRFSIIKNHNSQGKNATAFQKVFN